MSLVLRNCAPCRIGQLPDVTDSERDGNAQGGGGGGVKAGCFIELLAQHHCRSRYDDL